MASDSIPAVFGLNKFLWDRIEKAGILDKANYGGLTPIIPNQEVAGLRQAIDAAPGIGSHGFIVYSWYTNGYGTNWFEPIDTIIYRIEATNGKELRQLVLLTIDCFKRYDDSAVAINDFIQADSTLSPEYKAFNYLSVYTAAAQAGTPNSLEDESMAATVTVRVQYTNEKDSQAL